MDETEVQVEIACWAQEHPEASTINWDSGNEPWVDFSGRHCTLRLGLGGLTWSIQVPIGYQTEVDPQDGKRKRLWEPLDYHDTVIVQNRSTPFHVSVVDRSHNTLKLFSDLGQGLAGRSGDEVQLQMVHDMFKTLQVKSNPQSMSDTARVQSEGGKTLRKTSNACLEALKKAETLAEVLDGIHGLAKLYYSHILSPTDTDHDAEGTFFEDEDDEHLFDGEMTMRWSSIAAEVNHAREVCAYAAARSLSPRVWAESDVNSGKVSKEYGRCLPVSFPSCSHAASEVTFQQENLKLASPPGSPSDPSASSDTDDDYTYLLPGSLAELSIHICEDLKLQPECVDASGLSDFQCDMDSYDSDSDRSDGSWEIPGYPQQKSPSNLETESLSVVSWPRDPVTEKSWAKSRQGPDDCLPSKRMKVEQSSWKSEVPELEWCDIAFNSVSFSVECTLRLKEFMDNLTVATALGFALEHPLRVEIVPNKSQVDSLSWTGAVEVYVSQHSDWHNHISEEICGLLCLVPDIVQTYFNDKVPTLIRNHSELDTMSSKGDLFVGLLQTLVRRLININAGGSCCVCGKRGDPPTARYMQGRRLWPCDDNLCRATYATWEEVSSLDSQERERDENSQLCLMEESLRETFSYSERDALNSALEVYSVNGDNMNYSQQIKALARIELWNQKDPETSTLSYPVFEIEV